MFHVKTQLYISSQRQAQQKHPPQTATVLRGLLASVINHQNTGSKRLDASGRREKKVPGGRCEIRKTGNWPINVTAEA
jgi:hypothetical protein